MSTPTNNTTKRGQVSQGWIFRCGTCANNRIIESTSGRLNLAQAEAWARNEKWSKTKEGWKCPACVKTGSQREIEKEGQHERVSHS